MQRERSWYITDEALSYILKLIKENKIKSILEIGTGHGYSTINFSKYVEKVVTIEKSQDRLEIARKKIKESKLKNIKIIEGDAKKILGDLKEKFDFVFIDGMKKEYLDYFKKSLKLTKKIIVADDTNLYANKAEGFLEEINKYKHERLNIGKGLVIIWI